MFASYGMVDGCAKWAAPFMAVPSLRTSLYTRLVMLGAVVEAEGGASSASLIICEPVRRFLGCASRTSSSVPELYVANQFVGSWVIFGQALDERLLVYDTPRWHALDERRLGLNRFKFIPRCDAGALQKRFHADGLVMWNSASQGFNRSWLDARWCRDHVPRRVASVRCCR